MAEGIVSGTEPLACFESWFSAIEMLGLEFMKSSQSSCYRRSDFLMQSDVQTTKDPNIMLWLYDFDVPLVLMLSAKLRVLHSCDSFASIEINRMYSQIPSHYTLQRKDTKSCPRFQCQLLPPF